MIEDGVIPKVPVFLDSPLAEKITEIYKKHQDGFKDEIRKEIKEGDDIFSFPGFEIVETAKESAFIEKTEDPKIILAGSGMSEGGRVVNHEMNTLSGPNNTVVLVGYQSPGTFGRRLEDGVKEVTMYQKKGEHGRPLKITVRAKIETIKGYSSHMDSDHLVEFVEKTKPKKVFTIMGEPKSSLFLCQRIREYLDIDAVYPEADKVYELE
jgi:metallo-beta-lactamase family protein